MLLDGADVGVRTEEDVLKLRFLLVGLLDGLLWTSGDCGAYVDGVAALQGEFLGRCHGLGEEERVSDSEDGYRERETDTEMVSRLLIEEWEIVKGVGFEMGI